MNTPKLPTDMRDMLATSGLPWRIENGSSHLKLIVGDRLTTILPKSNRVRMMMNSAHRNAMSHIRRAIREQRQ
jgi:hypothetical protein